MQRRCVRTRNNLTQRDQRRRSCSRLHLRVLAPLGTTGGGIERSTLSTSGGFAAIVTPISGATGFTLNSSTMYWTNAPSQQSLLRTKGRGERKWCWPPAGGQHRSQPRAPTCTGRIGQGAPRLSGARRRRRPVAPGRRAHELPRVDCPRASWSILRSSTGWAGPTAAARRASFARCPLTGVPDGAEHRRLSSRTFWPRRFRSSACRYSVSTPATFTSRSAMGRYGARAMSTDRGRRAGRQRTIQAGAIITDGVHVYWETSDGKIVRAAIDGSGLLVLADLGWGTSPPNAFQGLVHSRRGAG